MGTRHSCAAGVTVRALTKGWLLRLAAECELSAATELLTSLEATRAASVVASGSGFRGILFQS